MCSRAAGAERLARIQAYNKEHRSNSIPRYQFALLIVPFVPRSHLHADNKAKLIFPSICGASERASEWANAVEGGIAITNFALTVRYRNDTPARPNNYTFWLAPLINAIPPSPPPPSPLITSNSPRSPASMVVVFHLLDERYPNRFNSRFPKNIWCW